MIHVYTDASFGFGTDNDIIAGICYYMVYMDNQYKDEVLKQELNVCYFTKEEIKQVKHSISNSLIDVEYTNSIIVEYLAILKALESIKPLNDRVVIYTDLKDLKDVILRYIETGKIRGNVLSCLGKKLVDTFNHNNITYNVIKGHDVKEALQHKLCDYLSSYKDKKRKVLNSYNGDLYYDYSYTLGKRLWNRLNIFNEKGISLILRDIKNSFES